MKVDGNQKVMRKFNVVFQAFDATMNNGPSGKATACSFIGNGAAKLRRYRLARRRSRSVDRCLKR
jgi:hypothetical protein